MEIEGALGCPGAVGVVGVLVAFDILASDEDVGLEVLGCGSEEFFALGFGECFEEVDAGAEGVESHAGDIGGEGWCEPMAESFFAGVGDLVELARAFADGVGF